MSQLPEWASGHDLTGWTEGDGEIFRPTVTGVVVSIDADCQCVHIWALDVHEESEDAAEAVRIATELATKYGGWAPAPIGSDPGWQPIETYQIPAGPTFPAFIGGNSETGFVGECYWASVGQEFQHYGGPVELTHFKPHPAPPEAKP